MNEMSAGVAICRTDYPGSENMIIPLYVASGHVAPLVIVNQSSYYTWQGRKTSAQYYVNPPGISSEDGCRWGNSSVNLGNWAPIV